MERLQQAFTIDEYSVHNRRRQSNKDDMGTMDQTLSSQFMGNAGNMTIDANDTLVIETTLDET